MTAHAEICPVCRGTGNVTPTESDTTAVPQPRTCHGCNGAGWVAVWDADMGVRTNPTIVWDADHKTHAATQ